MGCCFSCGSQSQRRDEIRKRSQDAWEAYRADKTNQQSLLECIDGFRELDSNRYGRDDDRDHTNVLLFLIKALVEKSKLDIREARDLEDAESFLGQVINKNEIRLLGWDTILDIRVALGDAFLSMYEQTGYTNPSYCSKSIEQYQEAQKVDQNQKNGPFLISRIRRAEGLISEEPKA